MRKLISTVRLLICALTGILWAGLAIAQNPPTVTSAPEVIKTEAPPYTTKGTTMVPMRSIFEWLGAEVRYNAATRLITAKRGETTIELRVNNEQAQVNGKQFPLTTPVASRDGITFVPLRFVAEALGTHVSWDEASTTLTICQGERLGTLAVGDAKQQASASTAKLPKRKINEKDGAEMVRNSKQLNVIADAVKIIHEIDSYLLGKMILQDDIPLRVRGYRRQFMGEDNQATPDGTLVVVIRDTDTLADKLRTVIKTEGLKAGCAYKVNAQGHYELLGVVDMKLDDRQIAALFGVKVLEQDGVMTIMGTTIEGVNAHGEIRQVHAVEK
jgi:hypothetical protein